MPNFAVTIEGEGLDQVREALNRADVPTVGPPYTKFDRESDAQTHVGHRMAAVLDADTAEAAEARVRENLPAGDYRLEASRWG
jgi:hypothetical protein